MCLVSFIATGLEKELHKIFSSLSKKQFERVSFSNSKWHDFYKATTHMINTALTG